MTNEQITKLELGAYEAAMKNIQAAHKLANISIENPLNSGSAALSAEQHARAAETLMEIVMRPFRLR